MYAPFQRDEPRFEVRFNSLFDESRALVFPCDALGRVDLDKLPERARANYLYARALVGRDYSTPTISPGIGCAPDVNAGLSRCTAA
jgi:hypothetical protein